MDGVSGHTFVYYPADTVAYVPTQLLIHTVPLPLQQNISKSGNTLSIFFPVLS